jgi:hypothetical protein
MAILIVCQLSILTAIDGSPPRRSLFSMTDPITPEPNPYATPAPYGAPVGAPAPRTNTLAIIALILGIVVPIGGIITGHIALGQIKRTGEAGHGLALAGTIVGYALTVLGIIVTIAWIALIAAGIGQGYSEYSTY